MKLLSIIRSLSGVDKLAKILFGSRQERDQYMHSEITKTQDSYVAEFADHINRTWWDSLIDGINRLPRPVMAFMAIYYLVLPTQNIIAFQKLNIALGTIPEPMWLIIGGIMSFFFGSRHFQKMGEMKSGLALSDNAFREVRKRLQSLEEKPPLWYEIAKAEMQSAVHEIKGDEHHPRIVAYHQATSLKATDDETAWCSAFVNWCMMMAGIPRTNRANARSWLEWGKKIKEPRQGCVVIFKRGNEPWMGHVGFFVGVKGDQVMCLGGNQGDEINISSYPKKAVLGYRWPE